MMIPKRSVGRIAAILGVVVVVAVLARGADAVRADDLPAAAQSQDARSNDEWGPESDGIRCRLVAISPRTNDEAPDLKAKAEAFAIDDDLTFGVELKNVSDEPITLLGVRFGDFFPNVRGTLNTVDFGPRWFEFEFRDKTGAPIPHASRAFGDGDWAGLHEASTHNLAPGQSLVVALRPMKFCAPMAYRLPRGDYLVRVRYRGPSEDSRKRYESRRPGSEQSRAWTGEVTSNAIAFSVASGQPATPRADLHWGEINDGLRAAVELRPRRAVGAENDSPGTLLVNSVVDVALHVENVSERAISLLTDASPKDTLTVSALTRRIDGDWGRAVAQATTGMPRAIRWTLQPGETAEISTARCAVVRNEAAAAQLRRSMQRVVQVEFWEYKLRYTLHFGSVQLGPERNDWQGELTTGELPLVVR